MSQLPRIAPHLNIVQYSALGGALQELDKTPRGGDDEEFTDDLNYIFATMFGLP